MLQMETAPVSSVYSAGIQYTCEGINSETFMYSHHVYTVEIWIRILILRAKVTVHVYSDCVLGGTVL